MSLRDTRIERLAALTDRLRESDGCDALLITNPVDIRYLTGFVGDDACLLVPVAGSKKSGRAAKPTLLSDGRFTEQIERELNGRGGIGGDAVDVHIRGDVTMAAAVARRLAKQVKASGGKRRLGLQAGYATLGLRDRLREALKKEAGKKQKVAVVGVEDRLFDQRMIKSADEVRLIRKAGAIQQAAFEEMREWLEPGVSEVQVAGFLEYCMRWRGADGPSFNTIVAAGANAALPHAVPGSKKLTASSLVLVDWGAKYDGYCSDMTRVFAMDPDAFGRARGKAAEMRDVCGIVLEAQQAGIDACVAGASLRAVDEAARNVIRTAGYGKRFSHGLGHGLGLDIHEGPRLSKMAPEDGVLKPGMVVTVEPGIYLPGVGGCRIEDDVHVTERGPRVLTSLERRLW